MEYYTSIGVTLLFWNYTSSFTCCNVTQKALQSYFILDDFQHESGYFLFYYFEDNKCIISLLFYLILIQSQNITSK